MKRRLAALLAASALAMAVPVAASAHENDRGYNQGSDWDRGDGGYNNFRQEFQHLYDGLRHGQEDGSFSRGEARQIYWAINSLRQRLDYFRNNDGYLDRREANDIQIRLNRLHQDMHALHDNAHDEQNYGYGGRNDNYGGDRNGGYRNRDDGYGYQRR